MSAEEPPTVAAVIPTRNRPELLRTAVESARAQTVPPAVIVVVDDASDVPGVDDAIPSGAPEVRLIRTPEPSGGSAARNLGWRSVDTDLVAFLDDDDTWTPNKLERQLTVFRDPGVAYSWTAYRVTTRRGARVLHDVHSYDRGWEDVLARSDRSSCTLMARRSALEAVGGFDESLPRNQDWDLYVRLARETRGAYLDEIHTIVRHHFPDPDACIAGRHQLMDKWSDVIDALPPGQRRLVFGEHHWRLWSNYADKGSPRDELAQVTRAIRFRPAEPRFYRSLLITLLHMVGWRGRHTGAGTGGLGSD